MLTDKYSDEIKSLYNEIEENEFNTEEDIEKFIYNYSKLIFEYKMVGLVYDYYHKDVILRKENRINKYGVESIITDVLELLSQFPNMKVDIESIIVSSDNELEFKIWRRMRYYGINTNYSKYGAPTGKSLGDGCLGLSMIFMKKIDEDWKIIEEINTISSDFIKEICTI